MKENNKKPYLPLTLVMKEKGKTTKDLADLLAVSISEVDKKLNGEIEWELTEVKKVCNYFDMSAARLFTWN